MSVTWPDLSCTVDEVAVHIRARTKDRNGNEVGTFNDDTRPTADQVQEAIDQAVKMLGTVVGVVGERCADAARAAVAIGAAADIERSYFPEQSRSDRSVYQFLRDQWNEAIQGVAQCVLGNLPSADEPSTGIRRHGTMLVTSGVVSDHYSGRWWPVIEPLPELEPEPEP